MDSFQPFAQKMRAGGCSQDQIARFQGDVKRFLSGEGGCIREEDIESVGRLPARADLLASPNQGDLPRLVVIKLNGGLGTSMGLDIPKGAIAVKQGLSFLAISALQVQKLAVPLILMNSFATRELSLKIVQAVQLQQDVPPDFLQSRVPKIDIAAQGPASYPEDPDLEWCPPGHGEIYSALRATGLLDQLLEQGYHYAFVSNVDNLGASVDTTILRWVIESELDFAMEVTARTPLDRKGGHLARRKHDGRLVLREVAQCPSDQLKAFEDVDKHRYFNTNNLWINLKSLKALSQPPQLPLIVNRKNVNPADRTSAQVVQLESAMGAAISSFPHSQALEVERQRFVPVKTTADMLRLSSDLYQLDSQYHLNFVGTHESPEITLDDRFFRNFGDYQKRFPLAPSLKNCLSLRIEGDVGFTGAPPVFEGHVHIHSGSTRTLEGPGPFHGSLDL